MSGAEVSPPRRLRRRHALAVGWRHCVRQEGAATDAAALEARLRDIAAAYGVTLPPGADLPEILARLPFGGGLPPEWLPVLTTLLLPLCRPDAAPRSVAR
jgi:hypothetical protein